MCHLYYLPRWFQVLQKQVWLIKKNYNNNIKKTKQKNKNLCLQLDTVQLPILISHLDSEIHSTKELVSIIFILQVGRSVNLALNQYF